MRSLSRSALSAVSAATMAISTFPIIVASVLAAELLSEFDTFASSDRSLHHRLKVGRGDGLACHGSSHRPSRFGCGYQVGAGHVGGDTDRPGAQPDLRLPVGGGAVAWNAVGMLAVMEFSPDGMVGKGTGLVLFGFLFGLAVGPPVMGCRSMSSERIFRAGSHPECCWALRP